MYTQQAGFEHNFEILRQNLNGGGEDYLGANNSFSIENLRPVEEVPPPYQTVFAGYASFNRIQSRVIDDALYTDKSLVVSAPTGSGKTAIFELAIVRLLITLEKTQSSTPFKIVYISPMKALCEERLVDWHKKFSNFGINAISVTGDSDIIEFQRLLNHNLIITTPEKWDCLTRKWRDNAKLVQIIKLFLIDEIHLLNEENRGSVLETIVCRMKTIEESINPLQEDYLNHKIRFVAVSATVPNIEDVAEWIGANNAKAYKFSDEYRPVKLNKIVLGYSEVPKSTPFKFDLALSYKLSTLIKQYSHGKPTLIFCSTRKIVEMTARHILHHLTINLNPEQKQRLIEDAARISDVKVKETLIHGVGYHHAGMLPQTRRVVENLFRNSKLPILVTTSTLAMGVNLPAHLVIIKSTKYYASGGFKDYTEIALNQMIGRAGRPQFDTEATALILTTSKDKEKFEKMIGGLQPIESDLHRHLIEHLNAEVVLQTITDLEVAMRWLASTFLYIRARKNPRYYGLTSSDPVVIDRRLLEMCQIELNKLTKAGMLTIDSDVLLRATPVGSTMAKYYLAFETMKLFTEITGFEILQQILGLIAKCHEFSEMYLRVNDKKCLNLLNKCRNGQSIRFPLNGKIKTLDMKINCIIQAVLGCLDICDHSILSETLKIMRNGERIVKCLIEYLETKNKCYQALLSTIILAKCFNVKLWENSPFVSKQLAGIGTVMSSQLVNAGKTSFELIAESDPREIEMILNKKPPTGNKILEQIEHLPKYELKFETYGKNKIKLTISLINALDLQQSCTVNRNSLMYLLVGDGGNNILLYEKYSHSFFIETPDVNRLINVSEDRLEGVVANFISEDWVGIDRITKYEFGSEQYRNTTKEKVPESNKKNKNEHNTSYMQTFMDMYMKCKKKQNQNYEKTDDNKENQNESKIIIHSNISIFDKKNFQNKNEQNEVDFPQTPPASPRHLNLNVSCEFTPAASIKKCFQFTPKKLHHKRSFEQSSTTEPPIKKIIIDEKPKNPTKITWRSPLTYSPPVKFSPKINYSRLNDNYDSLNMSRASSVSNQIQESKTLNRTQSSYTSSTPSAKNTETSKILNKTLSSYASRTPLKVNLSQSKIIFPLSDKDAADSSLEDNVDRRSEILDKVGDVASASFLENFGLISPIERRQSQIKTPNEYYHHLLSQSREKKNEEKVQTSKNNPQLRNIEEESANTSGFFSGQASSSTRKFLNRSLTQKQQKVAEKTSANQPRRMEYCTERITPKEKFPYRCTPTTQDSFYFSQKETPNLDQEAHIYSAPREQIMNRTITKIPTQSPYFSTQTQSLKRPRSFSQSFQMLQNENVPTKAFLRRHTSSNYSKRREESEDDPFNDSFDKVLMNFNVPSQIDRQSTRKNSFNSTAFEDLESLRNSIEDLESLRNSIEDLEEDEFDAALKEYQIRNRSFNVSDENHEVPFLFNDEAISTSQWVPGRNLSVLEKNRHFPEFRYEPVFVSQPIFPRNEPQFYPSPRGSAMSRPHQRNFDGYGYLREVMERPHSLTPRYDVDLGRPNTFYRFSEPEKENFPVQNYPSRSYDRGSFAMPMAQPPQMIEDDSQFFSHVNSIPDKSYLMQKFLSAVRQEREANFYF